MFNINIGDFVEVIEGNSVLYIIDCEVNDFNLFNFRYLIKYLEGNWMIRYFFVFFEYEFYCVVNKFVDDVGVVVSVLKCWGFVFLWFCYEKFVVLMFDLFVGYLKVEWDVVV